MASIAHLQHAQRALLFTPATAPQAGGFVMAHDIPEAMIAEWGTRYLAHDLWTTEAQRIGAIHDGNVMLGTQLVPDEQLVRSVFYREFLSRLNIRRMCTSVVFAGTVARLPMTACAIYRGSEYDDFDASHCHLLQLTARHLSQALGAMLQLRDTEFRLATSLQGLDRLTVGVLLLGQRGEALFANRSALALLSRGRGLSLRAGHPLQDGIGWLQAADDRSHTALHAGIRAALANDPLQPTHFSHGLRIARGSATGELVVQIVPVIEQDPVWGMLQPGALVFVTDAEQTPRLDASMLQRLYGVSAAECRVAQELLHGDTLQDVAQRLNLGENTVKSHLRQLFAKTGTHRQPQLVRLLLALIHQP
ncbi:helix-turn-helix transcriptional regulator [Ottowia sp. GY511]|nr:helix-turn-helix transcriptional regulator [Ottowia sp. GY511]